MSPDLRAKAEAIVRSHTERCFGEFDPFEPYCSAAPAGTPLCPACRKFADAIAVALDAAECPERTTFEAGWSAGLAATDKFGEQHATVEAAWIDYRLEIQAQAHAQEPLPNGK